jgi:hypothetical protein
VSGFAFSDTTSRRVRVPVRVTAIRVRVIAALRNLKDSVAVASSAGPAGEFQGVSVLRRAVALQRTSLPELRGQAHVRVVALVVAMRAKGAAQVGDPRRPATAGRATMTAKPLPRCDCAVRTQCSKGHLYVGSRCPTCRRAHDVAYGYGYRQRRRVVLDGASKCQSVPRCPYPDAGSAANPLTTDHVVPVSHGGTDSALMVLCLRCNSGKRDRALMRTRMRGDRVAT